MRNSRSSNLIHAVIVAGVLAGCYVKEEPEAANPNPEPARANLPIDAKASYNIVGVTSKKCVQFAGPAVGSEAQIATCNGSAAQQFRLEPVAGGYYTVHPAGVNVCLDVEAGSTDDGAAVKGFGCHGGPNQQWMLANAGGGAVGLVAHHSGKGLDIWYERTDDGTPLKQFRWKGTPNQQFRLTLHPSAAVAAAPAAVDHAGATPASGQAPGSETAGIKTKGKRKKSTGAPAAKPSASAL